MSKRYAVQDATEDDFYYMAVTIDKWVGMFPAYKHIKVDTDHTIEMIEDMWRVLYGQVLIDTQDSGIIVGALLYTLSPSLWSPELEATELFFCVEEQARSLYTAVDLIRAAEAQAFEEGAQRFTMGNSAKYDDAGIAKLYTRLGFMPHSGNFIKEA